MNLKHGILAKTLLATDDLKYIRRLERNLLSDLNVGGTELEGQIVQQILASLIRLSRFYDAEQDHFTSRMLDLGKDSLAGVFEADDGTIDKLQRYRVGAEKSLYKAISVIKELHL